MNASWFFHMVCFVVVLLYFANAANASLLHVSAEDTVRNLPLDASCLPQFITQPLDHFDPKNTQTFQQRYFLCVRGSEAKHSVLFFYTGNEGDANLYRLHTGLMWESASEFNALLIFAEHRFYGASIPCHGGYLNCGRYLRINQALKDYAELIKTLQKDYSITTTITFGGSYGGMLSAYMRLTYPDLVTGAIAASAPVNGFVTEYEATGYFDVVQANMKRCSVDAVQRFFNVLNQDSIPSEWLDALKICPGAYHDPNLGTQIADFVLEAFSSMSMGNYPYPSDYLTSPNVLLPAFPIDEACSYLHEEASLHSYPELFRAMGQAIGVFYNATMHLSCYNVNTTATVSDYAIWDYQVCSECVPQETPYYAVRSQEQGGIFFARDAFSYSKLHDSCIESWNIAPNCTEIPHFDLANPMKASNIVFSNGSYDPWSAAGVSTQMVTTSNPLITILHIEGGAHHSDLMFADAKDPPSVVQARNVEREHIRLWLKNAHMLEEEEKQ